MQQPFMPAVAPEIPNTHKYIVAIAENQANGIRMLQARLDTLISLQEKQVELLEQLLQRSTQAG